MEGILIIHKDYISAFIEIRKNLKDKEVPATELLDFLEDRKHEFLAQRKMAKAIAEELKNAERRIVWNSAWISFEGFCDSIIDYLGDSNSISNASWYTDFINFMKVSRLGGLEAKFFDRNVFGNDPRVDIIEHINILVDSRLPKKLETVQERYAELRIHLL
ncbi:hypothetical protein tloyanaT_32110 [Thalassotalea loyana]|uniref:Uncharacterized protein n=1 Tax=Thalassotalea loyana TaxID=280483 RepID=A0ABQ6HFV1_9GAMM|nr:hypothetical protein [Thalassotalea loyana]GLX86958.1 hypothetical protein tloyanaT_32110 [Thalassotalea loyana]